MGLSGFHFLNHASAFSVQFCGIGKSNRATGAPMLAHMAPRTDRCCLTASGLYQIFFDSTGTLPRIYAEDSRRSFFACVRRRSEEPTYELQYLMRISYASF